jgi:hypothetical protein
MTEFALRELALPALSTAGFHLSGPGRQIWRYHEFQGRTNDCAPFCVAMAANALLGEARYRAAEVARELDKPVWRWWPPPPLLYRRVPHWATFPWGPTDILRRMGLRAGWRLFGDEERLRTNLLEGRITFVSVGNLANPRDWRRRRPWGHVKVLYAWDAEWGWACVDPALNPATAQDEWGQIGIGWQPHASFMQQWRSMLRWTTEAEA